MASSRLEILTGNRQRDLRAFGFKRPLLSIRRPWVFAITLGLIAIGLGALAEETQPALSPPDVTTAALALGAFILAVWQWSSARHETSLDRFYDRLAATNQRLSEWPAARGFVPPWDTMPTKDDPVLVRVDAPQFQEQMYVYLELDNLEYAVRKYHLGFMDEETAYRILRTFLARYLVADFRQRVNELIGSGRHGYDRATIVVIQRIQRKWTSRIVRSDALTLAS